jgi:Na+:H+ antiporter, NhaA family
MQPAARPIDVLVDPLRPFFEHRLAGSVLLTVCAVVAFAWANSPWAAWHEALLSTMFSVQLGGLGLEKPLVLWINDGLMAIFFFVIGLEVKHELLEGALNSPKKAALPAIAALGGMLVPALCYLAVADEAARPGFGVPLATDIAFALGVLALLGTRAPMSLKAFLSAVAIADDIGAIIVIAVAYTEEVSALSLGIGAAMVGIAALMNVAGVRRATLYLAVGLVCWLAFLKSGLHATIASVLMAFTIPARTRLDARAFAAGMERLVDRLRDAAFAHPDGKRLLTADEVHAIEAVEVHIERGTAPLQRLEHAMLPLVTFVVLPVFAIANAGVTLEGGLAGLFTRAAAGTALGLIVGKPVGVVVTTLLAARLGLALPEGLRTVHIVGAGFLCGIGFTMSLFVASLAFASPETTALLAAAKAAVLLASVVSGVIGLAILWRAGDSTQTTPTTAAVAD